MFHSVNILEDIPFTNSHSLQLNIEARNLYCHRTRNHQIWFSKPRTRAAFNKRTYDNVVHVQDRYFQHYGTSFNVWNLKKKHQKNPVIYSYILNYIIIFFFILINIWFISIHYFVISRKFFCKTRSRSAPTRSADGDASWSFLVLAL